MKKTPYYVLLYYKYTPIENADLTCYEHRMICKTLGLLGRIYISHEGINGTCAGTLEQVKAYQRYMNQHPLFAGTEFKRDLCDTIPFRKMFVRTRPELAASDLFDNVDPLTEAGTHLSPKEFHEMIEKDPDVVLFDARNNYESRIGTFEGAITPDIDKFRDLQDVVEDYADLKDKKLLMFCTGGIRCEKASALFKQNGFKNVYQLDGGIVTYGKKIPKSESKYKGKCFVFDDRISVPITDDVMAACDHCGVACDRYLNCTNADCNKLFLCCEACKVEHNHACSGPCGDNPRASWKRSDQTVAV